MMMVLFWHEKLTMFAFVGNKISHEKKKKKKKQQQQQEVS